jgi:predicted amino acid dehydrogenase
VVTDVNLPTLFTPDDAAQRPDVLFIRSGTIMLPGSEVEMEDIDLPAGTVYPGLAETIILALEGRFETFTVGSDPEWERVREIYRLGLKHGMQLAAISGVDGVLTDEHIDRVKTAARKERAKRR